MKTMILAAFLAASLAHGQSTSPVSATVTITGGQLTLQLPDSLAQPCSVSTVGNLTDLLFTSVVQSGDTISGSTAFASSFTIPANSLHIGDVIQIDAGGTFALGPVAREQGYGIALDGNPILPAVQQYVNASKSGIWRAAGSINVTAVGAAGSVTGIGVSSVGTETTTGAVLAIDTTVAHVITVYSKNDPAESGDTATMLQFIVRKN